VGEHPLLSAFDVRDGGARERRLQLAAYLFLAHAPAVSQRAQTAAKVHVELLDGRLHRNQGDPSDAACQALLSTAMLTPTETW